MSVGFSSIRIISCLFCHHAIRHATLTSVVNIEKSNTITTLQLFYVNRRTTVPQLWHFKQNNFQIAAVLLETEQ
jgi:hypothetical protein